MEECTVHTKCEYVEEGSRSNSFYWKTELYVLIKHGLHNDSDGGQKRPDAPLLQAKLSQRKCENFEMK